MKDEPMKRHVRRIRLYDNKGQIWDMNLDPEEFPVEGNLHFSVGNFRISATSTNEATDGRYGYGEWISGWRPDPDGSADEVFSKMKAFEEQEAWRRCMSVLKWFVLGHGKSFSVEQVEILLGVYAYLFVHYEKEPEKANSNTSLKVFPGTISTSLLGSPELMAQILAAGKELHQQMMGRGGEYARKRGEIR